MSNTIGRSLQSSANRHNCCAYQDSLFSAKLLADRESDDGAKETSNIIDCGNNGKKVGFVRSIEVVYIEIILRDYNATFRQSLSETEVGVSSKMTY